MIIIFITSLFRFEKNLKASSKKFICKVAPTFPDNDDKNDDNNE